MSQGMTPPEGGGRQILEIGMGVSTGVRRASRISASQLCHETGEPVAVLAVPSGLLLDANEAFCQLFQITGVEDWTEPVLSCAGRGTARLLRDLLKDWDGTEDRWIPRASFSRPDGSRIQAKTGLLPVPGVRKRIALLHLLRGRQGTETGLRTLIDQRLEQLRSLEHLRALGEFSSVMVHEIRTPLTSLRIGLDLVRQDPAFDSRLDRRMDLLVDQVHRIDQFLGQVRDFAKPVSLDPVDVPVRELVRKVSDRLTERFPRISIEGCYRSRTIFADPKQLREVLENILLNAAEASDEEGRVRIRVSRIRKGVRVSVKDEGSGMSPSETRAAFQLFHTTKRSGTGLGLPIVKKIVDLHGGRVKLVSAPGEGTEVQLDFPSGVGGGTCVS